LSTFTPSGKRASVDSLNAYLTIMGLTDWEATLLPQINMDDEDLIADVGLNLFERLKSLTTALWTTMANVRKESTIESKKKEFLGRNAVDRGNESLGAAMDAGDDETRERNRKTTQQKVRPQRKPGQILSETKLFNSLKSQGVDTEKEWPWRRRSR
jgi:hypothetical protein